VRTRCAIYPSFGSYSTALVFQSQQSSLGSFEKLLTFEQSYRVVPDLQLVL